MAGVFPARPASAELEIATKDGWRLSTDGRINSFLSIARGDWIPPGEKNFTGLDDEPTSDNKIASARVRTGFLESILAFELNRKINDSLALKGRVGLWMLASSDRTSTVAPAVEAREAFFKIDGDWGGILVGRAMSLFSRGAILLNSDIEHNYGLGSPCATKVVSGGSCGHAGFGVLFPGYHAAFVYNTPSFGGVQVSAGLYDPAWFNEANINRTPVPRVESELTFEAPHRIVTAFVGGLWQRIEQTQPDSSGNRVDATLDAYGVNAGVGVNVGPLQLGFTGYTGQGLGMYVPVENNPQNFTPGTNGLPGLRGEYGYYGAAALVFNGTKLAAGAGLSGARSDPGDPPDTQNNTVLKQQLGYSAGIYQTVFHHVTFAAEYFRAEWTWFDRGNATADGIVVVRPHQTVHFINVGATLVW